LSCCANEGAVNARIATVARRTFVIVSSSLFGDRLQIESADERFQR
jgi:hypothetical protein